ncbi:Ubiquitin-associated and SH3 domain-containing protein B [Larimichthys crocea]|uniref:Ubiquitin-associated and SH3 domain-containing protein B n=1 Tax=Larimichthys crocea TaxID=215358 RepID=A0A6G0I9Y1_LARCR|nr:Ubiquitin-associated and SH3 domain-containing protein B [Larimichthys crocea]
MQARLFSHVDDPFLDDPLAQRVCVVPATQRAAAPAALALLAAVPRVLRQDKAHNIFPHITRCADGKVEALSDALQATVLHGSLVYPPHRSHWSSTPPPPSSALREEEVAEAGHLPVLEKLAKRGRVVSCDWLAVLFSRDIRFANHETLQVMYPYAPQNDDELELVPETSSSCLRWSRARQRGLAVRHPLLGTACRGSYLRTTSHSVLNCASPSSSGSSVAASLFDGKLSDSLLDSLMDPCSLAGICPLQVSRPMSSSSLSKMRLFVCRHGERMDVVFGKHWVAQCFDSKGRYIRSNLNMPPSLPARSGGHRDYDKDCPITVFGSTQARLVGEALLESHAAIDFVYCSPSLRCVQTAQHILQGLQQDGKTKIRVEPGLFEWTKWVSGTCLPTWIPPAELAADNLSVDTTYRPHVPISKLAVSESYDTYISRSFQVTREILAECNNLGNTVLIVAHASSLEACTRQIQGLTPQTPRTLSKLSERFHTWVFVLVKKWERPGCGSWWTRPLPLTHGPNHSFNWREMLMQD